jgi:hypothetical protein
MATILVLPDLAVLLRHGIRSAVAGAADCRDVQKI